MPELMLLEVSYYFEDVSVLIILTLVLAEIRLRQLYAVGQRKGDDKDTWSVHQYHMEPRVSPKTIPVHGKSEPTIGRSRFMA